MDSSITSMYRMPDAEKVAPIPESLPLRVTPPLSRSDRLQQETQTSSPAAPLTPPPDF